jgi:hypothetical protein
MSESRRRFLRSLSRSALVLPFGDLMALAQTPLERSYNAKAMPAPKGPKSPIEGTPLGVSFVDVVKESGLVRISIFSKLPVAVSRFTTTTTTAGWMSF